MIRRCRYPSQDSFKYYGGRGIKVCDRWSDYANFLADMGEPPPGYSLERDNVDGDYARENCRWIPLVRQSANRRSTRFLTWNGQTKGLCDWARELGIKPKTLRARLDDHGMSIADALTAPIQQTPKMQDARHAPHPWKRKPVIEPVTQTDEQIT